MTEPMNRRTAMGAIAGAGALLGVPLVAEAESVDAGLIALCRQAKGLYAELMAIEARLEELDVRFPMPSYPQELVVRERDLVVFARIRGQVGMPFTKDEIKDAKVQRQTMIKMFRLIDWGHRDGSGVSAEDMLSRCVEIEEAGDKYEAARAAAREAGGHHDAEKEIYRRDEELHVLWREIAFMPARTLEGVIAKLDAVSLSLARATYAPDDLPDCCTADDVAAMAGVDLAAIRSAQEA